MLKALGVILLVALILVGALMPLRYTARMRLPKGRNAGDLAPRDPGPED